MAMPRTMPAQGQWTVEDMWALLPDDGNRYEVIDGVLYVTPSPGNLHQDAVGALFELLRAFLRRWPRQLDLRRPRARWCNLHLRPRFEP